MTVLSGQRHAPHRPLKRLVRADKLGVWGGGCGGYGLLGQRGACVWRDGTEVASKQEGELVGWGRG